MLVRPGTSDKTAELDMRCFRECPVNVLNGYQSSSYNNVDAKHVNQNVLFLYG